MKILVISSLLCLTATWAQAQEVGHVLSRTAVYQQVAVPRQNCTQTQITPPQQTSGGGAIVGAITGGVIGSQFGGAHSNGITTMAGVIGGAILGDKVERQGNQPSVQTTCTTQTVYENRLVGYNVIYEFAGKQYNVQLPQDPGPTIHLQVTPVSAPPPPVVNVSPPLTQSSTTTFIQTARVVYVPTPHYRHPSPVYWRAPQAHGAVNFVWREDQHRRHWR